MGKDSGSQEIGVTVRLTVKGAILYRKEGGVLETREVILDRDDISGFEVWELVSVQGATVQNDRFYHSMIANASTEAPMQDFFADRIQELQDQGFTFVHPTPPF
jgi:hypothetical protein